MKNLKFYENLKVTRFLGEIGQKLAFFTGYACGPICYLLLTLDGADVRTQYDFWKSRKVSIRVEVIIRNRL